MIHEPQTLSPRRRRKRHAKIERILDGAMSIVVDEGLDSLTVHRLAERLDYSPGALYRYFPSMAAVLVALEIRVIDTYRALLETGGDVCRQIAEARALDTDVAALFDILALAELYRGFAHHRPVEYQLIARLLADPRHLVDDETAAAGVSPMLEVLAGVAGRLSKAAAVDALRPGSGIERALVLWSGLLGVQQLRKLERFAPTELTFDRLSVEMTRALLRGWGATDPTLVEAESTLEQAVRERPFIEIVEDIARSEDDGASHS